MPQRIQRRRTRGWKMPAGTVNVTRPGKWGNEYRVGDTVQRFSAAKICETFVVADAAMAVACYRERMELALAQHPAIMLPALAELRGKDLACWCAIGAPCHADVLLELANR